MYLPKHFQPHPTSVPFSHHLLFSWAQVIRYAMLNRPHKAKTVNILRSVFVLFWQLQGLFPLPLTPLCISCGYNFFFQTVFVCQRCRALTYANRELKSACVMQSKHPFRDGAVVGRLSHILLALISILGRRHCFHCFLLNIVVLIQSCFVVQGHFTEIEPALRFLSNFAC